MENENIYEKWNVPLNKLFDLCKNNVELKKLLEDVIDFYPNVSIHYIDDKFDFEDDVFIRLEPIFVDENDDGWCYEDLEPKFADFIGTHGLSYVHVEDDKAIFVLDHSEYVEISIFDIKNLVDGAIIMRPILSREEFEVFVELAE